MLSSVSTSLKHGTSGSSEPMTRLGCIRHCQETVQDLVVKPLESAVWLHQIAVTVRSNPSQPQQLNSLAEKRSRYESTLEEINTHLNLLRHLFVRLREIHEKLLTRDSSTTTSNNTELSRLLKQKSIYEEILQEKQLQLKITIDTIRDITYQINTMTDLRHDGTMNTLMNNTNTQEK